MSKRIIHVIPVGGEEPLHSATCDCHCTPLVSQNGTMAMHNAIDLREKWERQGLFNPKAPWCLIGGEEIAQEQPAPKREVLASVWIPLSAVIGGVLAFGVILGGIIFLATRK